MGNWTVMIIADEGAVMGRQVGRAVYLRLPNGLVSKVDVDFMAVLQAVHGAACPCCPEGALNGLSLSDLPHCVVICEDCGVEILVSLEEAPSASSSPIVQYVQ